MNKTKYIIDASVFMRFESGDVYDKACFPKHYDNFIKLLNKGVAISLDKVKNELIKRREGKEIYEKCENSFKPFYFEEFPETYEKLLGTEYSRYFEYYESNKPESADPFLVIYAYHHKICLVTQEKPKIKSPKMEKWRIPNICSKLGATCIDNEKLRDINTYEAGFGCICFTELIRLEKLYL